MAVSTSKRNIAGSWFPSGYYGHFRSKSRNDYINEFRQLAKPPPPNRFARRLQETATGHAFSKHDNRQVFLNDALIFEEGLGRRRVKNTTFKAKEDLVTWMPTKKELESAGPHPTSYQVNYYTPKPIRQIIINRPRSCLVNISSSTYRCTHGKENPFRIELLKSTREPFSEQNTNRIQRASSKFGRDSVAACLSWYHPKPPPTPKFISQPQSQNRTGNHQLTPTATEICVPKTPQRMITADITPLVIPNSEAGEH